MVRYLYSWRHNRCYGSVANKRYDTLWTLSSLQSKVKGLQVQQYHIQITTKFSPTPTKPLPCLKVQPTNCHIGWNTQYCPMFSQNRKQIWFISKAIKRTYPSFLKISYDRQRRQKIHRKLHETTIAEAQLRCICRWDISMQQYEALCAVRATHG